MVRKFFVLALVAFTLVIFGCEQQLPDPGNLPAKSDPPVSVSQNENPSGFENPVIPPDAPLPPPSNEPVRVDAATTATPRERTLDIKVYFPDDAGINLVAVKRRIRITNEPEKYASAVKIIMASPKETELTSIFPKGARLNGVTVDNGTAYVDFGSSITKNFVGGSTGEELLVYSVVDTLTEFPEIKRVQILIDGAEIETLAGHMDLSEPLTRNE